MLKPGEKLYLIDGIGPFFRKYKKVRINWSKIPWRRIQKLDAEGREAYFSRVRTDLETFCSRTSAIGCNVVSLDDLPHLADHAYYEESVREDMAAHRDEFRKLFGIVKRHGMKVYLTMDVMVYTAALLEKLGSNEARIFQFLTELFDQFFLDFADVDE